MSTYATEFLERVFDRTSGRCHLCRRPLAFRNHGRVRRRGAWHVDHSQPSARGGVDDLRNLYAACVSCNCSKRDGNNRRIRREHGYARAPLSRRRGRAVRVTRAVLAGGATYLAARSALALGPAVALAVLAAAILWEADPDDE